MSLMLGIGLVLIGTIIGAFGALLLKLGSKKFSISPKALIGNWQILLGCLLYAISTIPFIIALRFGPLSVMYPFVSTSYIWVAFLSMIFLKEKMTVWKWAGIVIIMLGVVLIGFGAR